MRLSVVIPAVNEAACIERAVTHALSAGFDEVLVADGGSQDNTPDLAARCGASVVHGPRGRAVQQNLGAQHATGEAFLFLHADNWLGATTGQQVRTALQDEAVLGGALQQCIDAPGLLYRLLERGNAVRVRWSGLAYGDQAIFMRRKTFDELGGFPPVELMEDLLLMRNFRKRSKPRLLPGPVHVHPRRWQQEGIVRQTLRNWSLLCGEAMGVTPARLAKFYPSHDTNDLPKF